MSTEEVERAELKRLLSTAEEIFKDKQKTLPGHTLDPLSLWEEPQATYTPQLESSMHEDPWTTHVPQLRSPYGPIQPGLRPGTISKWGMMMEYVLERSMARR